MSRLRSFVASLFVAWHSLVLVVAPAPSSVVTDRLQEIIRFYSGGLHLDSAWRMFVHVSWGGKVDYVLNNKNGEKSKNFSVVPADSLASGDYFHLQYQIYDYDRPQDLVRDIGKYYCRKHADLKPISLTFVIHYQQEVPPKEFFSSMDPRFVQDTSLEPVSCLEAVGT